MTAIMGYFINAADYFVQLFLFPWDDPTLSPMWVSPKINHSHRIRWYTSGFK